MATSSCEITNERMRINKYNIRRAMGIVREMMINWNDINDLFMEEEQSQVLDLVDRIHTIGYHLNILKQKLIQRTDLRGALEELLSALQQYAQAHPETLSNLPPPE